jgi:hypothetical protein
MKIEPQRGAIPITLDRPRVLFFDMAATWLLAQRYGAGFVGALYTLERSGKEFSVKLKDPRALAYFLWAGLQAEISDTDELLTEQQAEAFIRPWTFQAIFNAVVLAITGGTATPVMPGKPNGAAASPVEAPAPKQRRASTTTRRRGSSAVH